MDRTLSAIVAAVALAGLAAQTVVLERLIGPRPGVILWVMAGFFTILANALVLATFALRAAGRHPSASWHGAVLAWIAVTGIVFHLLLARAVSAPGSPFADGLGWWAAQALHTAVPLLVLLHWLLFAPKGLRWRDALLWLLLPGGYAAFALWQGSVQGSYPYPFLDPVALGWGGLARSVAAMLGAFLALHLVIVAAGRRLA